VIYLDNNATTQPLPEVIESLVEALHVNWCNPSSVHACGRQAREALEHARHTVASTFGAESPSSIVFTSGGTESINLACACLLSPEIKRILVASTEHSAVLRAAQRWAGVRSVVSIPSDSSGALDLGFLETEIKREKSFVCIAIANNETGIITDVAAVSRICRAHGAILHIDAVQGAGKIPFSLADLQCDAASLSAHKFHGPLGCGILYLKHRPTADGFQRIPSPGHQERGLRGGTENLPAIVGCGVAAKHLQETLHAMVQVGMLRDDLETKLFRSIPGIEIHSQQSRRLPNTSSIYCPGRNAADLVATLSSLGVAVSAGAACSNGTSPSHVIRAMGYSERRANSTVRISLSRFTSPDHVLEAHMAFSKAYELTPAIP
jgi:cysteine desulfurase